MNRSLHLLIAAALGAAVSLGTASTSEVERASPPAIAGYRSAVARAAPSVVTAHSAHTVSGRVRTVRVTGIASGVIVRSDGYIVTNFHAVEDTSELVVGHPIGPSGARILVMLIGALRQPELNGRAG